MTPSTKDDWEIPMVIISAVQNSEFWSGFEVCCLLSLLCSFPVVNSLLSPETSLLVLTPGAHSTFWSSPHAWGSLPQFGSYLWLCSLTTLPNVNSFSVSPSVKCRTGWSMHIIYLLVVCLLSRMQISESLRFFQNLEHEITLSKQFWRKNDFSVLWLYCCWLKISGINKYNWKKC